MESVEGSLEFEFGVASASFAAAYENPDTKAEIERTLQTAVASGLLFVDPSDVTILGVTSARALHARRLSSTSVDYAIKVPLGKGAEVAAEVTEIDTSTVAASAAQAAPLLPAKHTLTWAAVVSLSRLTSLRLCVPGLAWQMIVFSQTLRLIHLFSCFVALFLLYLTGEEAQ